MTTEQDRDNWKSLAMATWGQICVHHTDTERAAITCPCCLKARAEKAEADLLDCRKQLAHTEEGHIDTVLLCDRLKAENERLRFVLSKIASPLTRGTRASLAIEALAASEEKAKE